MRGHAHKLTLFCLLAFHIFYITGCKKQEDITTSTAKPEKVLSELVAVNSIERIKIVHLYSDTVYTLESDFLRLAGEQLIIDAGTLIKANPSAAIIIRPDALIVANGSSD